VGQFAGAGGLQVILTSQNPSLLKLSVDGVTAPSSSITVTVPQGQLSASYYLVGVANAGTASYTATASGYAAGSATHITLTPSGFIVSNPFGNNASTWSFPLSIPHTLSGTLAIQPAQLDSLGNFVATQQVAAGQSYSITVTSSDTNVATVTTPVVIGAGSDGSSGGTFFAGKAAGSVTVSITQPGGFTTPNQFSLLNFSLQ